MHSRKWQVQEAKTDWSGLIMAAQEGPQEITKRGEPIAVVVSYPLYKKLARSARKSSLVEFFAEWPEFDIPERDHTDTGREITF